MFHDLDDAEALLGENQAHRTLPSAPTDPLNTHAQGPGQGPSEGVMNFTAFSSGIMNGGGSKVLAVEVVGGESLFLKGLIRFCYSCAVAMHCTALACAVLSTSYTILSISLPILIHHVMSCLSRADLIIPYHILFYPIFSFLILS